MIVDWGDSSSTTFIETPPGSIIDKVHAYADDGVYSVTVTVREEPGDALAPSDSETFTVTVANVAPSITKPGNQTADEGTAAVFDLGSFTDPGDDDPWSVSVDWDDGSTDTTFTQATAGPITDQTHTYADDGVYLVTITVREEPGTVGAPSDTQSFQITVANLAPVVTAPADQTADEGTATSVDLGTFTDPGDDDPWTVSVDWGDGSALQVFADSELTDGDVIDRSHTYADDGTYSVTVTVRETGGAGAPSGSASFDIVVANVAPAITKPGNQTADEGTAAVFDLGSFTDPGDDDPWSVSIDWDDGSTDTTFTEATPGPITDQTHTYADDGVYLVTITVREEPGTVGAPSDFAVVPDHRRQRRADRRPRQRRSGQRGQSGHHQLRRIRPTPPASIPPPASTTATAATTMPMTWPPTTPRRRRRPAPRASSTMVRPTTPCWAASSTRTTASATYTTTVAVDNVAPSPAIGGAPASGPEGTSISLTGSATDPSTADTAAGFTFAWSVTKNAAAYASGAGSTFTFTPNDNATYVVTLTATDKDGGTGSTSTTITVTNVAPVVTLAGPASANEGNTKSYIFSWTDPGADTWTRTVSCGTGGVRQQQHDRGGDQVGRLRLHLGR